MAYHLERVGMLFCDAVGVNYKNATIAEIKAHVAIIWAKE